MKVYISGKITGTDLVMSRRRFDVAELLIDSIGGLDAVNPMAETFPDSMTWQDIMLVDIRKLFNCDAIYMMNGWQDSTGAKIEYGIALQMHMTILFESNMIRNNTESLRIQAAIHEDCDTTNMSPIHANVNSRMHACCFAIIAVHRK